MSRGSIQTMLLLLVVPLQADLFTTTTTSGGGTTTPMSAHQHQQHHGFDLPDPLRKFPSSVNLAAAANVEFNEELSMATLLGGQGIDRRLMATTIITMVIIRLTTTSNSISASSSMRTQRRMKTPQQHTAHITFSTYLRQAHRLPLRQHFLHTFPLPPPLPMEEEQGVNQIADTKLIKSTHSILPCRR